MAQQEPASASPALSLEVETTLEDQAFDTCLDFIQEQLGRYPPGTNEDEEFREQTMMDHFRNAGAPMTLVKQLRGRYQGGNIKEYTTDLGEVVGLLMFALKDEPCLPSSDLQTRDKMLALANAAYQELDQHKRKGSAIAAVKEEGANDSESTTKKHRAGSETSSRTDEDEDDNDLDENEGGDDDADDSSSSSSSSSSKSRKEMNRLIEATQYVHTEKIAQIQASMGPASRRRVEKLLNVLHTVSLGSEDDCLVLSEIFAPMFARPPRTAYMSIRHHRELPGLKLVLWVWIENFTEISNMAKDPQSLGAGTKSAASTPPPATRHLLHAIKPRLSSVSSAGGFPFNSGSIAGNASTIAGENAEGSRTPSPSTRHSRKKTPPRVSDLMHKRRIDFEQVDHLIASTVGGLLFDLSATEQQQQISPRVENWIAVESGQLPIVVVPSSAKPSVTSSSEDESQAQAPRRQWATRERVIIEKRVLKKRLLHWDKEFEQKHKRKPGKEDRHEMRSVFHAYGALKTLLQALEATSAPQSSNSEQLLLLEKRALQAVLKLFEKDFEERMGRKVEVAADIAGRELEYSRYKELKENVKAT